MDFRTRASARPQHTKNCNGFGTNYSDGSLEGGEGYSRVASGETLQWHQGFFAPLQSHSFLKDILDPPPPPSLYPASKVKSLNSPMPPLFPVRILRMELEDVQDLSGLAALRTARMASCTLHQRKG